MPPAVALTAAGPQLLEPPVSSASRRSHPFPLGDGRALLVGSEGDVLLWDEGIVDRLPAGLLPDARVVRVAEETYTALGGSTTRYAHGALGDDAEAGELHVFTVADGLEERARATFKDAVVEGLFPLSASFGDSGNRMVVVTLTDQSTGARLVGYDPGGNRIATSPAIGGGFRWRHQLCVAPFGPEGQSELVVIKIPHIGGVVEFYRVQEERFTIVAERSGYSSHSFGSRNLDGGLAGDLDGDAAVELLVPTQAGDALAAIRRTEPGVTAGWQLPLPDRLQTNVAGVTTRSGRVVIGAGTTGGRLQFWGSEEAET